MTAGAAVGASGAAVGASGAAVGAGRVPVAALAGGLAPVPIVGSAVAVVTVDNPFSHHLTPPCPFHAITGLWCPFCGGTRAVWAATHGEFHLMFHSNALLPVYALFALWAWMAFLGRLTRWWRVPAPGGRAFYAAAAAVLVVFTVVRNLPGLGALAPPGLS